MTTTNEKGAQTEGAVLAALLRAGYTVLMPFGVVRYDLVIEVAPGDFKRVQCKTAHLNPKLQGVLVFKVCSTPPGAPQKTYVGDADFFGVYSAELDQAYLVPVEDVADLKNVASLRVEPAANGQSATTRWAEKYIIGPVAQPDRATLS